jgi:hypothetical protein
VEKEQFLIPLTLDDLDAGEDMIAAGLYVEAGLPTHAAIIIRHNSETRVFHFYKKVLLEPAADERSEGRYVFIKKLDLVPVFLIPSCIAHCELICKEAKPVFGFFYDARSLYDASGKFQNPGSFPEYMTCVGFCLTFIQS